MKKVIKKEFDVEESLRKRLEIICDFLNTTPTIEIYINNLSRKITINELDNKPKEVEEIINDLKQTLIKKDNYILK